MNNTCGTCRRLVYYSEEDPTAERYPPGNYCDHFSSNYYGELKRDTDTCLLHTAKIAKKRGGCLGPDITPAGHEPGWKLYDAPFHDSVNARWVWTLWTEDKKIICHIEASTEEECRKRGLIIAKAPLLAKENRGLKLKVKTYGDILEELSEWADKYGEIDKDVFKKMMIDKISALTEGGDDGRK